MAHLSQEPDVKPTHVQVQEGLRALFKAGMTTIRAEVVFSQEGYTRAMHQTVPGMDPWAGRLHGSNPTHYLGLPFRTDRKQTVDVLVRMMDGADINKGSTA